MSKKFLRQSYDSDSDDDEEDEDEDLSEDDDDDRGKKRKKGGGKGKSKKKSKSSFFEEEAEATDEDEEEEDEIAKYGEGEKMDDDALEIIRQQDRRRAQAARFGERSVMDLARDIENRHRMQHRPVDRSRIVDRPPMPSRHHPVFNDAASVASSVGGGGGVASVVGAPMDDVVESGGQEVYTAVDTAVAQQSLVPSVSDPSFWMISCPTGKEQELVLQIMNKCVSFARQGRPLGITAAVAAQSKGKVYIESFSEPAVMETIQGVRSLMQYTMKLVPIGDMTTVMTVVSTKRPVKKNEWVRMTRGNYKGDLALVREVRESGLKCIVQCVPRLDLADAGMARSRRKNTARPPQKFFSVAEAQRLGKTNLGRNRHPILEIQCDVFEGNYYLDGYLLKEMTVGSMIKPCTDDDPPTLDELQSFQHRPKRDGDDGEEHENEGSQMAASLLDELAELQGKTGLGKGGNGGLLIGDTIEVIEGDLVGMRGKLVSLDGTTVKVKPNNATVDLGGTDEVEFLIEQVRKYIAVGAHVKVTDGRYANETGTVVAVEQLEGETDFTAVVLTDMTNKEISVRTSQLRESAEVASFQDKLAGYELYDLVVLSGGGSANEVGVIVRVGREDFTVINNHGVTREVRPEELRGKRNSTSNRAVALDVQGSQLRCGDTVNVAEGPHKGKMATIKRMSRAQLFLHSQTRTDHAGIFVVRSRSCMLAGAKAQKRGNSMDGGTSPYGSPHSQGRGGPPGGGGGRAKRDDGLVGKTVRVQAGQWKGYLGTVSDSTATHVQVELHSRLKKVMVVRERVVVVGDKFGATENTSQNDNAMGSIAGPATTMATPMHAIGGATPAIHGFGGATPSHGGSDSTDEVWRPGSSIDQEASKDDGWGSTANDQYDASATNGSGSAWGSSTSTWGGGSSKEENGGSVVKSEQDGGEYIPGWFMRRVCVKLKTADERSGVIKEMNGDGSAVVVMEDDKSETTVRPGDVSMTAPVEHDTVLVTGGNEVGLEGSLVCVDGSDAIIKDANDEFKIIDFVHLVKISNE